MKRVIFYGAAAFFPRMYTFLAIFIFSRMLSVPDFGLYVLAIAVGEFCDFAAGAWFRVGFLRRYHPGTMQSEETRLDLDPLYKMYLRCTAASVALCWISAFLLVGQERSTFAIVCSLYVIGNGTVQASLNTLRGESRGLLYLSIEAVRPL